MHKKDRLIVILDMAIEYLLYCMIFFLPISIAITEIVFAFSFTFFILKKILKPDFRIFLNPAHFFVFLFLVFLSASLSNSGIYFNKSLTALFGKWLEYIAIFILVQDTLNTAKRVRNLIYVLLVSSVLIGIDSIYQQITRIDFIRRIAILQSPITATFKTPNSLATYLSIILLYLITLSTVEKSYWKRIFMYSFLIIIGAAFILTFSRGSWLGFISGLFLLAFLPHNFKKPLIFIFIFSTVLLLFPITRERIIHSFFPGGDAYRFAITNVSWVIISGNLFLGKGVGTYMLYFKQFAPPSLGIQYAHNSFLQIWAESGIFALLSFILFVCMILFRATRAYKKSHNFTLLGLVCGIFGFLVHSFFDNQLYSLQLATYFWFLLGLLVSATRLEQEKGKLLS